MGTAGRSGAGQDASSCSVRVVGACPARPSPLLLAQQQRTRRGARRHSAQPPACPVHQQAAWGETWHIPQADGKETSSSHAIRTPNHLRHFYSAFHPRAPRQAARRGKPQHCAGGAEGGCTVPKSAGQGGHPHHFCIAPALPCTPVPFLLPPCQHCPLQQWVPLLPPPSSPAVTAELTGRQAACLGDYLDVIFLNKLDEVYLIKHSCHYNTQA